MLAKDLSNNEWYYAKMHLAGKYPTEEVYIMLYMDEPLPKWLEDEIISNRKEARR